MKRAIRKIHLWLAVPLGLFFTYMCITGCLLLFESEITDAIYSKVNTISNPGTETWSDAALSEIAIKHFGENAEVKRIEKSTSPNKAYRILMRGKSNQAIYVNQYNGEILGNGDKLKFFNTVMCLHRWLTTTPPTGQNIGKSIVGWLVFASLFILISGFIIWIPRTVKGLKIALTIHTKSHFVFWHSLHLAGGIYSFIVLLLIALTGLSWSFPAFKEFITTIFGSIPFKLIHTGAFWAIPSKILWLILVLTGASLPLTGYYIWLKKLKSKHK